MIDMKKGQVESSDSLAEIHAALARIAEVPSTPGLIEAISLEDWLCDDAGEWNIGVCPPEPELADELDFVDKVEKQAA